MTTTSSQLDSTSPPHSTLPPELIDQILQDSSLSNSDLARCCLVNKNFQDLARPVLYHSVKVQFILNYERQRWLDRITQLLFRTLSNEPSLGRNARTVIFLAQYTDDEDSSVRLLDDYGLAVEQALEMLPLVESVDVDAHVWNSDYAEEMIFNRGLQWKEIAVDGILLDEDTDGNWRTWSELPNLRKLRCAVTYGGPDHTTPIPDHLEVLDITNLFAQDFPLSVSPESQLRILRVILSDSKLQHLGYMRQLRHLYLFIKHDTSALLSETFNALSRLPLLESLSVKYDRPTSLDLRVIHSLCHHLPQSLLRLDFPRCIPFDHLTQFLKNDDNSQFQILGIAQTRERNWNDLSDDELEGSVGGLSEICEEKGIVLERVEPREDIFLV
ncbi:hypothetical protein JCM5353_001707 [Sporobolomyces roseus]